MSPSTKFLDPREQLLPFAVVKMPLAEPQDVRSKPSPKFPLNVAPESWRPYMELIRLEKVGFSFSLTTKQGMTLIVF